MRWCVPEHGDSDAAWPFLVPKLVDAACFSLCLVLVSHGVGLGVEVCGAQPSLLFCSTQRDALLV
jgi:hypothetical protein